MKTSPVLLFTLLLAINLPALAQAQDVPEVEATQLTEVIGTGKMEGAVADLAGNFYFCNMNAEGLEIKTTGNIAMIPVGSDTAEVLFTLPEGMRGNGLRIGVDGNFYMADQQGGRLVKVDRETGETTVLHDFAFEDPNWNNTPNDVAFSADGQQIYVSCMKNGIWRTDLDGSNATKLDDAYANGIEVSPDGKTLILATAFFSINDDGTLTKLDAKPELPEDGFAYTDGLRCDAEGNIYVSRAGGKKDVDGKKEQLPGAVHVFSPDGKLIRQIIAPYARVHNVGFGGPDGKTLFLICPGNDGFVASIPNETAGLNQQRLQAWAQ